jgi:hypothetical protein
MAYVAPCFYPFADIRRTIPQLDTPSFTGRKKPDGLPIDQPHFLQVERYGSHFRFRFYEFLQLRHVPFLDSTAECEDRRTGAFGSSNLQQLVGVISNAAAVTKLLKLIYLTNQNESRKSLINETS